MGLHRPDPRIGPPKLAETDETVIDERDVLGHDPRDLIPFPSHQRSDERLREADEVGDLVAFSGNETFVDVRESLVEIVGSISAAKTMRPSTSSSLRNSSSLSKASGPS